MALWEIIYLSCGKHQRATVFISIVGICWFKRFYLLNPSKKQKALLENAIVFIFRSFGKFSGKFEMTGQPFMQSLWKRAFWESFDHWLSLHSSSLETESPEKVIGDLRWNKREIRRGKATFFPGIFCFYLLGGCFNYYFFLQLRPTFFLDVRCKHE